MLLISYEKDLVPDDGYEVLCGTAPLQVATWKDAAGTAFHKKARAKLGIVDCEEETQGGEGQESKDTNDKDEAVPRNGVCAEENITEGVQWQNSKNRRKSKTEEKKKDLYALLGLQDTRWMASPNDIKKAYQKKALKHHPDKVCANVTDEAEKLRLEEKFKVIQDAFETLSDPQKRREYDSVDEFDDSLPEKCRPADFFAVFGAAFRRQSRWSSKTPVPDLGSSDDTYESVQAFYDFWFSFKSWREFPHEDEEDPECAECREHRRWIERENARLRNKAKKEETRRLREFVDRSHALDPRVVARKEEIRAERDAKKQEKIRAQQAKEEEKKRIAEEEAARKAAEEQAAKKQAADAKRAKQNDQRELRRQRKRLRDLCTAPDAPDGDATDRLLDPDDVEELCRELPRSAIEDLCCAVEACADGEDGQRSLLEAALSSVYASRGEEVVRKQKAKMEAAAAAREKRKAALREKVAAAKEWSEEEVRMLDKALTKFPLGVPRRWEQITAYIRTRSQDEILFMVKIKQGAHTSKFQQNDWRAGRKGGAAADVAISSTPDARDSAFTDVRVTQHSPENAGAPANGTSTQPSAEALAALPEASSAAPPAARSAGAKQKENVDVAAWSKEQVIALVKALKAVPKDADNRWSKIAELVEGKDQLECARRFKEMKAEAKASKS